MPYRLYLDESGDHTSSTTEDVGKRYLGLTGVIFSQARPYEDFIGRFEALKRKHIPHDPDYPLVMHRVDVVQKRGLFKVLIEEKKRHAFDQDLLDVIRTTDFKVVAVVIDKVEHAEKTYRSLEHPYHYCMHAMLERYCGWLRFIGDRGDVMAEARGKREDRLLEKAYTTVYERGTSYLSREHCQVTLTTRQLKIKPKEQNTAGLQLADILAHPLTRDVLLAFERIQQRGGSFADAVAAAAENKYNRQVYTGRINGYGRVLLT